jgi:hypothetical protein
VRVDRRAGVVRAQREEPTREMPFCNPCVSPVWKKRLVLVPPGRVICCVLAMKDILWEMV